MAMTETAVPAHVQLIQMGTAWSPSLVASSGKLA